MALYNVYTAVIYIYSLSESFAVTMLNNSHYCGNVTHLVQYGKSSLQQAKQKLILAVRK